MLLFDVATLLSVKSSWEAPDMNGLLLFPVLCACQHMTSCPLSLLFCPRSPECHRVLYAQHRAVCSSMLTKPLLPSQVCKVERCTKELPV